MKNLKLFKLGTPEKNLTLIAYNQNQAFETLNNYNKNIEATSQIEKNIIESRLLSDDYIVAKSKQ